MAPRLSAAIAPPSPHSTASSAGGSLTMEIRKSLAAAASCGDLASLAPAATSSSAREAVRFQTVNGYSAFKIFMPIGRPIRPSPISPTAGFNARLRKTATIVAHSRKARTLLGFDRMGEIRRDADDWQLAADRIRHRRLPRRQTGLSELGSFVPARDRLLPAPRSFGARELWPQASFPCPAFARS